MVAVGRDGREHPASSSTGTGAHNFVQLSAEFSGLSLKDIKVFRVQTRPYQQVEFRNVSLQPGKKTDVQVVEGAPHGIQPFDLLTIRVLGTMLFCPIDGVYLVEPSGQVSLGPAYGRARVQGLTVEGAEAAVHAQLKKILVKPDVQVTAAGHASQWRGGRVPTASSRISPDDLLEIRVLGTMLDQPIDGNMAVEPSGTIPLGPAYGRAMVKGLTLEEAEAAIAKHLEKVLTKPDVSVTLAGWKDDAQLKADREAAAARHERELKEWAERKKEKDQKRPGAKGKGKPSAAASPTPNVVGGGYVVSTHTASPDYETPEGDRSFSFGFYAPLIRNRTRQELGLSSSQEKRLREVRHNYMLDRPRWRQANQAQMSEWAKLPAKEQSAKYLEMACQELKPVRQRVDEVLTAKQLTALKNLMLSERAAIAWMLGVLAFDKIELTSEQQKAFQEAQHQLVTEGYKRQKWLERENDEQMAAVS